jgi:myo-inositol 2-dehydrogenase/D-chiro-inositol 1-dehydrogenase/scyllo-inositol 2-dehydrogenase (NAD+)
MNQPVRICLVGAGRVARVHAQSIARRLPGAELTAVVDPAVEARHSLAEEFAILAQYASLEEALEKERFQAVVITTPTPTHAPLAALAASRGKHVFLEKPMALSLAECDAIIQACRQNGVLLQLGFMRRFDPEFNTALSKIEAGEIGQPMMIKSLTHGPGLPPPWARDLKTSNGMLAEVNSHDWDSLRWLMGDDYQRVYAEVADLKGAANQVDTPDFYDHALVNVRFRRGGLGLISGICPCGYGYDARVEIYGEKGILTIGALQGQAVVVCTDRDHGLVTPIYRTWPQRFAWGYIYEMEHFVQCIQSGTTPKVSGEAGRWAVAGVLAATRSFMEERPVRLDEILALEPSA